MNQRTGEYGDWREYVKSMSSVYRVWRLTSEHGAWELPTTKIEARTGLEEVKECRQGQ